MNIYVVVEGKSTEPLVYRSWIPLVNPALSGVDFLPQVAANNFYIVGGGGWPYLLKIVENAVDDIRASGRFDRLVIAADSEDESRADRHLEIEQHLQRLGPPCAYRIIIQHFCFETWALGNRKMVPRKPSDEALQRYKDIHDVSVLDPELLPPNPELELNRSQFALRYLRMAIRYKGKHLTYSKNSPDVVAHPSYFYQLEKRLGDTAHIDSFQSFLDAFR